MDNKGGSSHEKRENLYTRGKTKKGGDIAILQYASRRTWGEVEDNWAGYKKLLVARSDKGSREIYRPMQYLSTLQE